MLPFQVRVDLGVMPMKGYSGIAKAKPSDCLVSYLGYSLEESYLSAEIQSVYSTAPADWATGDSFGGVLPLCRDTVGVFYCPSRLGKA